MSESHDVVIVGGAVIGSAVACSLTANFDFTTLDHNTVVGSHPQASDPVFANGSSGHRLQQGAAAGRGVSEPIIYGGFRTLDLSDVGYERIVGNRPFPEKAVI
nr:hypothetical protein [uncultured Roseovarius sp.]